MRKGERQPRPSDYDTRGRYYSALMGWLHWRYDDQVDRARKFYKITRKEEAMPVKRDAKATVETETERRVRVAMEEMLELAGIGPRALAAERARIIELGILDRDLEPDEQAEFARLVKRRNRRARRDELHVAAVDKRQRRHPEESRGDSTLAVILKRYRKRDRRDAKRDERQAAAELVQEQERAEAVATAPSEPTRQATSRGPRPQPVAADVPTERAPQRRRPRAGLVAQYDQFGHRVD